MRIAERVRVKTNRRVLRFYWGYPAGLFIILRMLVWVGMVENSPLAWLSEDFLNLATSDVPGDKIRLQFLSGFSWLLLALPGLYRCYRLDMEELGQGKGQESSPHSPD